MASFIDTGERVRLGFGTSALMSRVGRRDSLGLLRMAADAGITHIDTARSYGYGEAESAVGDLLAGQRDRFTVTTKIGILPPRRSPLLSVAGALARRAAALHPGLRGRLRRTAAGMLHAGQFDLPVVQKSFDTSLRQLRTGYVDFLLLHECSVTDLASGELLRFVEDLRQAGKIRHFGIAANAEVTRDALHTATAWTGAVQCANSVFQPETFSVSIPKQGFVFTHSVFTARFAECMQRLRAQPALAQAWSHQLGTGVLEPGVLARLTLQYALAAVPQATVLFSTTREEHIRANAQTLGAPAGPETLERFAGLVAGLTPSGTSLS